MKVYLINISLIIILFTVSIASCIVSKSICFNILLLNCPLPGLEKSTQNLLIGGYASPLVFQAKLNQRCQPARLLPTQVSRGKCFNGGCRLRLPHCPEAQAVLWSNSGGRQFCVTFFLFRMPILSTQDSLLLLL